MSRLRLAAVAATIACGSMLAGGTGVASAAKKQDQAAPFAQKVDVTGNRGFSGTYTIDRFVTQGKKIYAVGTLRGKLSGQRVTKRNVLMPATLSNASGAQSAQVPPTPGACQILNLVLGPIKLDLLGLRVRTNQINLRIEGVPGPGNLLGNLLCGITGILDPDTIANTPLAQLTQILNALLALAPRTA